MALTFSQLTTGNNGASFPSDSATTASVSPGANRLITIWIGSYNTAGTPGATATVTGNGITYTQVAVTNAQVSGGGGTYRTFLFRGLSASPSAGAISITCADANYVTWSVNDIAGVDTTGTNGSGAIVQSATNNISSNAITVTLAAFANAANYAVGGTVLDQTGTVTVGSGFTVINAGGTSGDPSTEYKVNDTTVDWTAVGGGGMAAVAIEVKEPDAAPASQVVPGYAQRNRRHTGRYL